MFASERRPRRATCALLGVLGVVALAHGNAHAAEPDEVTRAQAAFLRLHGDRPIARIRVDGLSRTRPVVVWQWIRCSGGDLLSSCDLPTIREQLYRLGIFSAIDVELVDAPEGVVVVFRIKEKWSLYPVPMLWYSPGTEIAGLILAEANLLGFNKGAALGAVYSNRGWYTLAGYNDPNVAFTDLFGSVHAFLGSGLLENDRPDGSIEQSLDMTRFDVEYQFGWTFWDRVSPTWTGGTRLARVGSVYVPGTDAAADATVALQGLQLVYSDRLYRDLYDEGLRLSVEVQHAFPLDHGSSTYNDAIFDVKWTRPAPLHGFFDARTHAFVGSLPVVFEERLGGIDGSRTIPGSGLVGADRYASLALAYQVPFARGSLGTAAVQVFGELGRYARNEEPAVTYGGPGTGLRFYLREVALPAVGVDIGYEAGSRRVAFSVAVGYRPLR